MERHPYTAKLGELATARGELVAALACGDPGTIATAARALLAATGEAQIAALVEAARRQFADQLEGASPAEPGQPSGDPGDALLRCLAGAWLGDQERREARLAADMAALPAPTHPALTLKTEKQRQIVEMLEAHPGLCLGQIAARVGASLSYVAGVHRQWVAAQQAANA